MFNRLIPFLYDNKILTESQNGFRKEKCVETTIQAFIEIIQEALDKGAHAIGIFIDLTKAYNTLNHNVLLEELSSYDIRGITNSWFKSYLTNRRQCVEINQSDSSNIMVNRYRSSFMEIKQGVQQWRTEGGVWRVQPTPLLRSFDKAKPNSLFCGKHILNNLIIIIIWLSLIFKLSKTPD
jgi:hypothetical protein